MTETEFEEGITPVVGTKHPVAVVTTKPTIDKVNNVTQKEIALSQAGVTRLKAFKVVAEALVAEKFIQVTSKEGVRWENVPDTERRQWGAEMAGKYFGDFIIKDGSLIVGGDLVVTNETRNVFQVWRKEKMEGFHRG